MWETVTKTKDTNIKLLNIGLYIVIYFHLQNTLKLSSLFHLFIFIL